MSDTNTTTGKNVDVLVGSSNTETPSTDATPSETPLQDGGSSSQFTELQDRLAVLESALAEKDSKIKSLESSYDTILKTHNKTSAEYRRLKDEREKLTRADLAAKKDWASLQKNSEETIARLTQERDQEITELRQTHEQQLTEAQEKIKRLLIDGRLMKVAVEKCADDAVDLVIEALRKHFAIEPDAQGQEQVVYKENGQTVLNGVKPLSIEEAFDRFIEKRPSVAKTPRMRGTGTQGPNTQTTRPEGALTVEQFNKMSRKEQQQFALKNQQAMQQFTKSLTRTT